MRQLRITKSITSREETSLEKYLQEIAKEELIDAEEEAELARRIRNGDREALERLTRSNLRFVISVAKQYQNQGLSLSDLINEGNIGLIHAAEKFDERRGFKFISYAVWWIRQSIQQALAEHARIVRVPVNQLNALVKINKACHRFEQQHERMPTPAELAEFAGLPEERVNEILKMTTRSVSMDASFSDDEEGCLLDILPSTNVPETDHLVQKESLTTEVHRTISVLNKKEREIIRYAYGLGVPEKTLDEIAEMMGMTRERVRQIKEKAIRRLRDKVKHKLLLDFLG